METFTTETTPAPKKKNVFLLVICILTFVGSGWGILGSFISIGTADMVANINSQYSEQMNNENTPNFLKSLFQSVAEKATPAQIKKMALVSLLSNLLTLLGAILMLKLRKVGFYLYVVGILIYISIPIAFIGGLIGIGSSLFYSLFGIGFIVMYAVNLKHMNTEA